jgi:NAD(P)-dependent dehydrogenase (short-subunit alcohol dehydrogenase family)
LGAYAASKIAGEVVHRVLASELSDAGLAVHIVFPGAFESTMQHQLRTQESPLRHAAREYASALNGTAAVAEELLHLCLDLDQREVTVGSSYRPPRGNA